MKADIQEAQPGMIPATDLQGLCAQRMAQGNYAELLDKTCVNLTPTPMVRAPSTQSAVGQRYGAALVTSNRNEIQYFGATVNHVEQLSRQSAPGTLLITESVWSDPGAELVLVDHVSAVPEGTIDSAKSLRQIDLNILRAIDTGLPLQTRG